MMEPSGPPLEDPTELEIVRVDARACELDLGRTSRVERIQDLRAASTGLDI
jgi:hypothetical protein